MVAMYNVVDVWLTIPELQGVMLVFLQPQQLLQNVIIMYQEDHMFIQDKCTSKCTE